MDELCKISLTHGQLTTLKRLIIGGRNYANRISIGLALRLWELERTHRESLYVLQEIDHLEGLGVASRTKPKGQFKHPPLYPFCHKHFSTPRHLLRNIGDRWGLDGKGKPLLELLNDIARDHGHNPDQWPGILAGRLVHTGYFERCAKGLTGDWIIYAEHEGKNYYLDLATHAEGKVPVELYTKLRNASAAEFPFLFGEIGAFPADVGTSE